MSCSKLQQLCGRAVFFSPMDTFKVLFLILQLFHTRLGVPYTPKCIGDLACKFHDLPQQMHSSGTMELSVTVMGPVRAGAAVPQLQKLAPQQIKTHCPRIFPFPGQGHWMLHNISAVQLFQFYKAINKYGRLNYTSASSPPPTPPFSLKSHQ